MDTKWIILLTNCVFFYGKTESLAEKFLLIAESASDDILEYFNLQATIKYKYVTSMIPPSLPVAIEYDYLNDRVIWSDSSKHNIRSVHRNDTGAWEIYMGNGLIVEGLALDTRAGNLYFTERTKGIVGVIKLGPNYKKTLISAGLNRPGDIVIHLEDGNMYIANFEGIMKANMDGTNLQTFVSGTPGKAIDALTIDYTARTLFWVTYKTGILERVNLDGTDKRVIWNQENGDFFRLATLGEFIYITDWNVTKLRRIKTDGSSSSIVGNDILYRGNGIVGYDSTINISDSSPCGGPDYGGCDQLCIPSSRSTYHCSCADGIRQLGNVSCDVSNVVRCSEIISHGRLHTECSRLASTSCSFSCDQAYAAKVDLLYCNPDGNWFPDPDTICTTYIENNFLLVSDHWRHKIIQIGLNSQKSTFLDIPEDELRYPLAIEYDVKLKRVFWADRNGAEIKSCNLDGTDINKITLSSGSNIEGLAFDASYDNLYYTDYAKKYIAKVDKQLKSSQIVIQHGLNNPRAIQVYKGYIYVTDWGQPARILRASVSGGSPAVIVTGGLEKPNGLVIDKADEKLYWVDEELKLIEKSTLHGNNRQIIWKNSGVFLFGIEIMENYLFVSDWNKKYVHQLFKNGTYVKIIGAGLFVSPSGIKVDRPSEVMSTKLSTTQETTQMSSTQHLSGFQQNLVYIGVGVGVFVLLAIILLICVCVLCRLRRSRLKPDGTCQAPIPMQPVRVNEPVNNWPDSHIYATMGPLQEPPPVTPPPSYSSDGYLQYKGPGNASNHQYQYLPDDNKKYPDPGY